MIKSIISGEEEYRSNVEHERERAKLLWESNPETEENYWVLLKRHGREVEHRRRALTESLRP